MPGMMVALGMPEVCPVNLAHMSLWPGMHGSRQEVQGGSGILMNCLDRPVRLHRSLGWIELRRTPTLCVTNAMPQQHCCRGGGNLEVNALIEIPITRCRVLNGSAAAQWEHVRGALKRVSRRN